MTTLLSKLTGTSNIFVNIFAATFLTLIGVALIALVANLIHNPALIEQAYF